MLFLNDEKSVCYPSCPHATRKLLKSKNALLDAVLKPNK
ncbi:hypothetical protein EV06_1613 [Prochlorococcus sp. MIT 0602]|nr:hypothetical protein EV06_1613 [Prochlorococcus sp. MIT 0602]